MFASTPDDDAVTLSMKQNNFWGSPK
jgi:hypothetical protein